MKELLKNAQDFKIIPNNFKSSGAFNITEITDNEIKAKLILIDEKELEDHDYIITVAAVTKKLALLAWFTYTGEENKDSSNRPIPFPIIIMPYLTTK